MSLFNRLRLTRPRQRGDVVAQASRDVDRVDQQLAEILRLLDRPTPPTNDVEGYALFTLRRSVMAARYALRRSIR